MEQPVPQGAALAAEQIARCRDLLVLLAAEREAIEGHDREELAGVIARKQPLVDTLLAGERSLAEVRAEVDAAAMDQLTGLLREVVARQGANQTLLAEHMAGMRERLKSLGQGRQTLTAYGASFKGGAYAHVPRFIDRQR